MDLFVALMRISAGVDRMLFDLNSHFDPIGTFMGYSE